jgi:hypothetical protein
MHSTAVHSIKLLHFGVGRFAGGDLPSFAQWIKAVSFVSNAPFNTPALEPKKKKSTKKSIDSKNTKESKIHAF